MELSTLTVIIRSVCCRCERRWCCWFFVGGGRPARRHQALCMFPFGDWNASDGYLSVNHCFSTTCLAQNIDTWPRYLFQVPFVVNLTPCKSLTPTQTTKALIFYSNFGYDNHIISDDLSRTSQSFRVDVREKTHFFFINKLTNFDFSFSQLIQHIKQRKFNGLSVVSQCKATLQP